LNSPSEYGLQLSKQASSSALQVSPPVFLGFACTSVGLDSPIAAAANAATIGSAIDMRIGLSPFITQKFLRMEQPWRCAVRVASTERLTGAAINGL
jgi:hypothetical protein